MSKYKVTIDGRAYEVVVELLEESQKLQKKQQGTNKGTDRGIEPGTNQGTKLRPHWLNDYILKETAQRIKETCYSPWKHLN